MSKQPQSYAHHAATYPPYHYVATPILAINLFVALWLLYRDPGFAAAWQVVMAVGLVALAWAARIMALTVQDRVIRLEERLRLKALLPEPMHGVVDGLKRGQYIALRFAPDEEVPALVDKIRRGELTTAADIKKAIHHWRPDYLRA